MLPGTCGVILDLAALGKGCPNSLFCRGHLAPRSEGSSLYINLVVFSHLVDADNGFLSFSEVVAIITFTMFMCT